MTTSGKEVFDGRPETVWETAKEIEAGPEPPHEPLVSWPMRLLIWFAVNLVVFVYVVRETPRWLWGRLDA